MGFWLDDINSTTPLTIDIWYHVVFLYDYNRRQQFIYLNGLLENTNILYPNAPHLYFGQSGDTAVGNVPLFNSYFIGYIDHVSVTHRTKTADESLCYFLKQNDFNVKFNFFKHILFLQ